MQIFPNGYPKRLQEGFRVYDRKVRVTVKIFNDEYTIKGTALPEYIEKISRLVDERMRELAKQYPRLNATKLAVLAAVNFADELVQLQGDYEELLQMLDSEKKQGNA